MAAFYVEIQGSRNSVHRLGGKAGGVRALAAGWSGGISVQLRDKDGVDWATVRFTRWNGKGSEGLIYDGPAAGAPK